jgi:hypothetical protein
VGVLLTSSSSTISSFTLSSPVLSPCTLLSSTLPSSTISSSEVQISGEEGCSWPLLECRRRRSEGARTRWSLSTRWGGGGLAVAEESADTPLRPNSGVVFCSAGLDLRGEAVAVCAEACNNDDPLISSVEGVNSSDGGS